MATLIELKAQRQAALNKAESFVTAAESATRAMTTEENTACDAAMAEVSALNPQIERIEKLNTLRSQIGKNGAIIPAADVNGAVASLKKKKTFSADYMTAFTEWVQSGGAKISASLVEGTNSAGGFAVPIVVDDQIVPLAPQEMAVRRLALVIPTSSDIKFPVKASFGSAAAKAESASFTEGEPTLSQFTLSAYMAGVLQQISWELAQDVPAFQAFAVDDMILDQQMYEENLYINGTGSGQAQGLIGNVAAPIFEEPDTNSNLVSVNGTLDLVGALNAVYHPNASWLMQRATSIIIRKAQIGTNLFYPVFTRVGNQDFLHGYPVEYATAMPSAARGHSPILFGDFKRGYIIGDRGGSGISVKVLDQPLASQGLLQLLAYRRTDGRVRRSEAIQQYAISAS